MEFSRQTTTLLRQVEEHSAGRLSNRVELGVLIELAHQHAMTETLDDLSFYAKFAYKTFGIMQRIGSDAEGYDRLSKEFGESIEKSKKLILQLLSKAPDDEREKFNSDLLAQSPVALQRLLTFLHDLSWYKNLRIDSGTS